MRLSLATLQILRTLLVHPAAQTGADLTRATGIRSGTIYPTLARLEDAGWVTGEWELGDPRVLGRPLRRFYRLTVIGRCEAQTALDGLARQKR